MENKNIFITGGAGFIANTLIRSLIEKNRITVYDNFTRDTLTGSGYANHPNITIVKGDVLDYKALEAAMKGCGYCCSCSSNCRY
jgi:UDP-glucose 4-epimerase